MNEKTTTTTNKHAKNHLFILRQKQSRYLNIISMVISDSVKSEKHLHETLAKLLPCDNLTLDFIPKIHNTEYD